MRSIRRFAAAHPLPFVVVAPVAWMMAAGIAAYLAASVLQLPFTNELPQSLGMLVATACLLLVMWRWGWLRPAGITVLGSGRLWLLTAGLAASLVVAYQFAFFGKIAIDLSASWAAGQAQAILGRQVVVGVAEETLFRGFLLYALVRVWGDTRRGLLAAVTLPALLFGLLHIAQVSGGNPLDDTLMTMLNCFVSGLWWGALVLLGGSLWSAVLIHAAINASFQIGAASLTAFDPSAVDYALATLAELPLAIAGFWLLLRQVPDSKTKIGNIIAIALSLTLLLGGCGGPAAAPTIEAVLPGSVQGRIQRVENGLIAVTADRKIESLEPKTLVERMAHYGVPGVSIAVIDDYQLEWARGYGLRTAGGGEAVTPQTLFHAGSVAKSISAAATLTLVEHGLLGLDDDVNDGLVSWHLPENEYTTVEKVTLRRLLSHSAGLKDGLTERGADDPMPAYLTFGDEVPGVTLQQLLDGMPEDDIEPTRVVDVPGTLFRYANADYAILELFVEDQLGQPFEDFVQAAVLDRLGMELSSYHQPLPQDLRALSASEHTLDGRPMEGGRANFPFHAAGSLWTTPGDLALFMIDLMQAYQGETGHLLSPQMARQMMSPQIEKPGDPLSDGYGLGVELQSAGPGPAVWHPGGTWGSCSVIWFYPEMGKGAVVMINSANGGFLLFEILLSIASVYGWPASSQ